MAEKPVKILKTLENAGFEAYFVGGCVRDTLLDRPVNDWDITTSATPEEIMQVFSKCIPTGLKHGTVTVVEDGEMYEITTFRADGRYLDGRHPEQVEFVRSLREDLARRDFTINAMAMDSKGNITDLFEGQKDLKAQQLRCVGAPERRFREDALRMLRALRFSAQLGFSIEPATYAAIGVCADLCKALSAERVREETEKILLSKAPKTVELMAQMGLLSAVEVQITAPLGNINDLPKEKTVRWAAFFRACAQADWETFRLDRKTGQIAKTSAALSGTAKTELQWKKLISVHGEEVGRCTAALDGFDGVEKILASGDCLFLKELAVGGRDFPQKEGRELGALLQKLLDHVLEHPEDNRREVLLALAQSL